MNMTDVMGVLIPLSGINNMKLTQNKITIFERFL